MSEINDLSPKGAHAPVKNDHIKVSVFTSELLSAFHGVNVDIVFSVLLPSTYYTDEERTYPIRYSIGGYGTRANKVYELMSDPEFKEWHESDDSPQVITVFLDGHSPLGDPHQVDSDNFGPFGQSLITELMPFVEENVRFTGEDSDRYLDGYSTGGWASLFLLFKYPEKFGKIFSYSPDPISFNHYLTTNIYEDENILEKNGEDTWLSRPNVIGEGLTMKQMVEYEKRVGGGTYVLSRMQFGAHSAVYGPRAEDGLPKPLFDDETGVIDKDVAEAWKRYDILLILKNSWDDLAPKIDGKIYLWSGSHDEYFLNYAVEEFKEFIEAADKKIDINIEITVGAGHSQNYSHQEVLNKIAARYEKD